MCACVRVCVCVLPVPLKYWETLSRTLFSLEPGVTISSSRTHKRPLGSPSAARTLEIHAHQILNCSSPANDCYNCIFISHVPAKGAANPTLKKLFHLSDEMLSVKGKKKVVTVDGLQSSGLFFRLLASLTDAN